MSKTREEFLTRMHPVGMPEVNPTDIKAVVGSPAPDFELEADTGEMFKLSDLRGKKVILYFYSRDNTVSCTQEARDFEEAKPRLEAAGYEIVGVSRDSNRSHRRFREGKGLTFRLLSDTFCNVSRMYGVLRPKSISGRGYLSIDRSTFIINEEGILTHAIRVPRVTGHVTELEKKLLGGGQ